ncbi:MAG: baseplate J/gp47 family protein [Lachnospiraceae bacterium]|nr:baseplate J/gp47 family protein [Lachnospiraceae bacterium]
MFEEFTNEYFLEQAKSFGDELGIDTRTGSVYMDMAAGHCLRAAFFFANLSELFNMFALDTCYADVLDDKAAEWGLTRHSASAAVFNGTFTGATPEVGDRFFAEDTEYYFTVIEDEESGTLYLQAETEGTECNTLSAGTEITPVDDIDGLEEAYLGEIYTLGADEETDDELRSRLREKIAGPAENGNRQHYKTWCEEIEGVGRARIIPLFAGENTVRAILYSSDGLPCSADVVTAVQEYIDPITQNYEFEDADGNTWICGDGWGDGVANLGAHFLATAAVASEIDVSFTVTLTDGATVEECRTAASEVITDYFQKLALESDEDTDIIVRISTIGAMLSELTQVLDYTNLTLNGGTTNITVDSADVPVLGEVSVVAAN